MFELFVIKLRCLFINNNTFVTFSSKGCEVPTPAGHREFALFESGQCQNSNCILSPGQKVASGVIMTVTCREEGYQLGSFNENTLIASCNKSYKWFPAIPTCISKCICLFCRPKVTFYFNFKP